MKCLTSKQIEKATAGDPPARFVLTDEPYNVPISGHVTDGAHREFAMASSEMTDAEFPAFNQAWMAVGYNGFQWYHRKTETFWPQKWGWRLPLRLVLPAFSTC